MDKVKLSSSQLGRLGETAVALELMKRGYDVINLNDSIRNYQNADLLCVPGKTGKPIPVQVKTGTTHNIQCGLTSTTDGVIPDLEDKVVCPWVFVHVTLPEGNEDFRFEFYVLTREETIDLIRSSNDWYANQRKTGRKLQKDIRVGVEVRWLEAEGSEETGLFLPYESTLESSSLRKWEKIA